MVERALGRLAESAARAADLLRDLQGNGRSEHVRLRAAIANLDLAHRLREALELEERVARLEEAAAHPEGNHAAAGQG